MNLELLWLHHWLIFDLGRSAWIICSHILNTPITSGRPNHHLHCSASTRWALCFISLIKSLNLAGLLQYLVVTSLTFQLLLTINATNWSQSRDASLARAGAPGEQATDHHLSNLTTASLAKLTRRSCIPQASASASAQSWCRALAGTGKPEGAAKQQLINLMSQ